MGWVPIQYKQLQLKVQKYKEGKLKEDKKWRKRPTAKAPAKKRRKTVEEDNKIFPMRMRRKDKSSVIDGIEQYSSLEQVNQSGFGCDVAKSIG